MDIDTISNAVATWEASNSWSGMIIVLAYVGLGWLLYVIIRLPMFCSSFTAAVFLGFSIMAFGKGLSAYNSEVVGIFASLIPLLFFAVIAGVGFFALAIIFSIIWMFLQIRS